MEWSDEYRPLLMQVYFKKPEGVKPMYSRPMVALAMELHVHPKKLYRELFRLRRSAQPSVLRLWKRYAGKPQVLGRDAKKLRKMRGFGTSGAFFDGIDTTLSFERLFIPITSDTTLTPSALVMILNVYFRLTPATMEERTPEIVAVAKELRVGESEVVDVMRIFQTFDPYLRRQAAPPSPMRDACLDVWQRFGNDPEALLSAAAQLAEYWK